jgi:hypothetical protein
MNTILSQLDSHERHDLQGAVRVLRFAIDAIRSGDRFDGADGAEQLQALEQAVARIEEILGIPHART